jgi:hypothetical protein
VTETQAQAGTRELAFSTMIQAPERTRNLKPALHGGSFRHARPAQDSDSEFGQLFWCVTYYGPGTTSKHDDKSWHWHDLSESLPWHASASDSDVKPGRDSGGLDDHGFQVQLRPNFKLNSEVDANLTR